MEKLRLWVEVIESIEELSNINIPSRSRLPVAIKARRIANATRRLGPDFSIVPPEGAFLVVCAEYELAVRKIIEVYASTVNVKIEKFIDLPEKLQKRNIENSAKIINELHYDRFQSLTDVGIVSKLHSCLSANTPANSFQLCEEALSYTNYNFKWEVVKDLFADLGISELIIKVAQNAKVQAALGCPINQISTVLPRTIDQFMLTRNRIIHKSSTATNPTIQDVKEASLVLQSLVIALEDVLVFHYSNL